jgi:hypothetical protein
MACGSREILGTNVSLFLRCLHSAGTLVGSRSLRKSPPTTTLCQCLVVTDPQSLVISFS